MKKNISIILIAILLIVPKYVSAYSINNYLDVKIGAMNYDDVMMLDSMSGFKLVERDNLDREIFTIEDSQIHIEIVIDSINILNKDNDLIYSFVGDGSIVIGSKDYESIVKVDKDRYRDFITFIVNDKEALIINHIDIENYLYGVVPKEIPASSSIEALKAQAVVARSFALLNLNKHQSSGFDLCQTTHCQVYGGYEWENHVTNSAIDLTFGEYVGYNGKVVDTPYHSNSGGVTENSANVWGGTVPYLNSVKDVFSLDSPFSNWNFSLPIIEVQNKLIQNGIDLGELVDIIVNERYPSNRVKSVNLIGSKDEKTILGTQLRTILGTNILKSTSFTVDMDGSSESSNVYIISGDNRKPIAINMKSVYILSGDNNIAATRNTVTRAISKDRLSPIGGTFTENPSNIVFEGKGYGHGVGMSQYGAMEMAKLGYNYEEIIKHYYNGVEILKIGK